MKLTLLAALWFVGSVQAQNVIFHDDFEGGFSNWTMSGLWHAQEITQPCSNMALPFPSGSNCVWYGWQQAFTSQGGCDFDAFWIWDSFLTYTQSIALPATNGALAIRFQSKSQGEDDGIWDRRHLQVRNAAGGAWVDLPDVFSSPWTWVREAFDVTAWAGTTIEFRFRFWAGDNGANSGFGWFVDDVEIVEFVEPAVVVCSGDGSWFSCPCSNNGGAGRGCGSSFAPAGAAIGAAGMPSVSADTLLLHLDGLSAGATTLFQASNFVHAPFEPFAGDGISCVGVGFVRVATRFAPGGLLDYPDVADPAVSLAGFVQPLTTRYYAARYRDAAQFCTPATFNITNTIAVYWRP